MNRAMEHDGTGEAVGHDAVEAIHCLLRTIDGILDACTGSARGGAPRHQCQLANELLRPVRTLADELRRVHGDDPPLRLGIMRIEQRLREHPSPDAPTSGIAS